jgi:hypothetical protein
LGDGVISGSPAAACDLKGLKVRIADSFDAAMSEGASFDIAVAPLTASLPAGGENFAERAQRDRRL